MQKINYAAYGEGNVNDQACPKWFAKSYEDFSLDDASRLDRPNEKIFFVLDIYIIIRDEEDVLVESLLSNDY